MKVNIKYFGMLTEVTGKQSESIHFTKETVGELLNELYMEYPELKNVEFKIAVDQQIADDNTVIDSGEVALLPPFSGG